MSAPRDTAQDVKAVRALVRDAHDIRERIAAVLKAGPCPALPAIVALELLRDEALQACVADGHRPEVVLGFVERVVAAIYKANGGDA